MDYGSWMMDGGRGIMGEKDMVERGMYGLPLDVKFCKKCVMSNQRPSSTIEFKVTTDTNKRRLLGIDEDGVCRAQREDRLEVQGKGAGGTP
jgi:hypothetical protein